MVNIIHVELFHSYAEAQGPCLRARGTCLPGLGRLMRFLCASGVFVASDARTARPTGKAKLPSAALGRHGSGSAGSKRADVPRQPGCPAERGWHLGSVLPRAGCDSPDVTVAGVGGGAVPAAACEIP